jgi:hypothetical protein
VGVGIAVSDSLARCKTHTQAQKAREHVSEAKGRTWEETLEKDGHETAPATEVLERVSGGNDSARLHPLAAQRPPMCWQRRACVLYCISRRCQYKALGHACWANATWAARHLCGLVVMHENVAAPESPFWVKARAAHMFAGRRALCGARSSRGRMCSARAVPRSCPPPHASIAASKQRPRVRCRTPTVHQIHELLLLP